MDEHTNGADVPDREEAARFLADLVNSPRVRADSLDAILALQSVGHGTLILRVPRAAGKPVEASLVTGGLQLTLFETQQIA